MPKVLVCIARGMIPICEFLVPSRASCHYCHNRAERGRSKNHNQTREQSFTHGEISVG